MAAMVAEHNGAAQLAGMPSRSRPLLVVAIVLAVACTGGEAAASRARAGGGGEAPPAAATRPQLPAVIDSITAESLAVDSAMRGLGTDPSHAIFDCLVGDSVVYADLRLDSFGDTVGVRITLWHAGDGIDGSRADVGEPVPPLALTGVRLFAKDSIMLDFPATSDPGETSRFLGRVSCDRMWGKQRNYREAPTRPVSYARVRDAY
jgi:hypothetical protein